jgi:hypothetical protein
MGLPAHPLLVHAPVVFVPLLALLAIAYAFIPVVRQHTRWVVGVLAVITPLSSLAAKLSGDAFFDRLDAAGRITEGFYPVLEEHQRLGNLTLVASVVLAVLTLLLVYFVRPGAPVVERLTGGAGARPVLLVALRVLVVIAAAVSVYYLFRTGDSGASAVWEGY